MLIKSSQAVLIQTNHLACVLATSQQIPLTSVGNYNGEAAFEMKALYLSVFLLVTTMVITTTAMTDLKAYGICLTRCKSWYDGCKIGSRNRPTLTKTICRRQFLTCMKTCRVGNVDK